MITLDGLFRTLLEHHGVDRYPTPDLALIKIQEELGEVSRAYLRGDTEQVVRELGDVILAVQGMARHYGVDALGVAQETVEANVGRRVDPSPWARQE